MPRRRISVFSSGRRRSGSSMTRQRRDYRVGRVDLVPQRSHDLRVHREVDVHPRAESYEAETLAADESVSFANVAKNAPSNQPGDLYAGDVDTFGRAQPQRAPFVLERGLVERSVHEASGIVPALLHLAVHRRAVGVHVEDVHEHADLDRFAPEIRIARRPDRKSTRLNSSHGYIS